MEGFKVISTALDTNRRYIRYTFPRSTDRKFSIPITRQLRRIFTDIGFVVTDAGILIDVPISIGTDDLMNLTLGITTFVDKYMLDYG